MTAHETRVGYNLIRGVVPVPDGWTPTPLNLRDPAGNLLPTQQTIGIRGPGNVPRTVFLQARAFSPSGGSQTYNVEDGWGRVPATGTFHNHITAVLLSFAPNDEASALAAPSAVTAFTSRLLQAGANTGTAGDVVRTLVRTGELTSGTGSRLWGWKAHITTIADEPDVWLVEMTIMNGNVGTPGSPLGASGILHDLFFTEIRLTTSPGGYSITHLHPTPWTSGTNLMTTDPGGKYHALMQGGGKHYRFAIHTASTAGRAAILLREFGFAVCDHSKTLWSWSNPATAWYGPHSKLVPNMDLSGFQPYLSTYTQISAGLAAGTGFSTGEAAPTTPLGPYHVHGPTDGGYTGGTFITPFRGYEVINESDAPSRIKAHMAILAMDADRSASKVTSGDTGIFVCDSNQEPINCGDWDLTTLLYINNPGRLNINHQGPWPRLNANQWRLTHANSNNFIPGYYAQLGAFNLYDEAHPIRPVAACVPLIYLRNDPLAKDFLAHFSTWGRLHTLEYGPTNPPYSQGEVDGSSSLWSSYEVSALSVQNFPNKGARGGFGGRIGGWSIFFVGFDWLATDSDQKRTDTADWFAVLKAHDELAQFQVGSKNWHALDNPGDTPVLNLIAQWVINGNLGTPNAAASQTIECGIRAGALLTVYSCTEDPDWLSMLASACDGIYDYHHKPGTDTFHFVCPVRPLNDITASPWATQAAAPDCFTEDSSAGGLDNYQVGTLVAAALAHDPAHVNAWATIYAFTSTSNPDDAAAAMEAIPKDKLEASWGPVLGFLQDFTSVAQVAPSPAVLALGGAAPTVDTSVAPSPAVLRLTVDATVTSGDNVTPSAAVIGLLGDAPALDTTVIIRPQAAVFQLIAPLMSINVPDGVAPSPAVVSLIAVTTFPGSLDAVAFSDTLTVRLELRDKLVFIGSP